MHELSICQALLQQVSEIAENHRARRVAAVRLRIGPLAGVEPALLERAFSLARVGTVAATADLTIVPGAVEIACRGCGSVAEVAAHALICPSCGSIEVRLMAGNEMILESLELDVDEAPAEAACDV